jgi:hypothetical protein
MQSSICRPGVGGWGWKRLGRIDMRLSILVDIVACEDGVIEKG